MRSARLFLVLSSSVLVGLAFAACGGKVVDDANGDAGADAQPTAKPTTTATPTPTTTVTPPSCPTYRPLRGTACTVGLSCFYPCSDSYPTAIRATCPAGTWTTADVESCPSPPPPPPPERCEACVSMNCSVEMSACESDKTGGCAALIDCLNACTTSECQNKCISDSRSEEGKAFIGCVIDKCAEPCSG